MNLSNNNKEAKLPRPCNIVSYCLPSFLPAGPKTSMVQGKQAPRERRAGVGHVPAEDFCFSLFFLDYWVLPNYYIW